MFAYIPARGGSKRIPKKNLHILDGTPLIVHVIRNLNKLNFLSEIFVSTDCKETKDLAEKNGATCLKLRKKNLANDKSGFIDLIKFDLPRFIKHQRGDDEVLFTLATAALVPKSIFEDAYSIYNKIKPDILMSCEEYPEPIWWAMEEKENGFLKPIHPKMVLKNSQDFKKTYTDSGLFYFFNQKRLSRYHSHKIVDKLQRYDVPFQYRCDVNNPEDLEILKFKYFFSKK